MASKILSAHTALVPGSDLWVLPQLTESYWTERINWYLNFQISRAESHKSKALSDLQIQEIHEFDLPHFEPQNNIPNALLIGSRDSLPNSQTIVLKFNQDIEVWLKDIQHIWSALGQPKIRIFAPKKIKAENISQIWTEEKLSIVESQSSRYV